MKLYIRQKVMAIKPEDEQKEMNDKQTKDENMKFQSITSFSTNSGV